VLEAVRRESRVAWVLIRNATVLSLDGGILTLRFPREGEMKGFSVSGHDAVLKRVLTADFGLNVTVKGVTGGDAGPGLAGGAPSRTEPAPPAPARVTAPSRSGSAQPEPASSGPAAAAPAAPVAPWVSRQPAPGLPEPPDFDEPPDDAYEPYDQPPDEFFPDAPPLGGRVLRPAELTGMELIQRELGGQVIGEIES